MLSVVENDVEWSCPKDLRVQLADAMGLVVFRCVFFYGLIRGLEVFITAFDEDVISPMDKLLGGHCPVLFLVGGWAHTSWGGVPGLHAYIHP